jgi:putative membrane protein
MLDLHLAIAHHLLIFALFGVLCTELAAVRRGLTSAEVIRLSRLDLWYGGLASLILIVGFSRALFAAKGWEYYLHNGFFWAKIGTFVVIGLLSAVPTMAFIRWRRAGTVPSAAETAGVLKVLWAEVVLFGVVLSFAASMARGYWQL